MVWGLIVIPSFLIFILISIFGTFFAVIRTGLLGLWVSLELRFFGFIPVLNGKTVAENEGACKYFIIQGVGSAFILIGFLLMISSSCINVSFLAIESLIYLGVLTGLMVKLGVFPFHFWFPIVIRSSSLFRCFWLSVIQKVGPFWVLSGLGLRGWVLNMLMLILVMTSILGSLGGLAQTQLRPLLAYSSLGQAGWIGLVCILNLNMFIVYIFIYGVLLRGLLRSLHLINSFRADNFIGISRRKGIFFWIFTGRFFISLRGIPPLAGCALKLVGILVILNYFPVCLVLLILSSIIRLYFYLGVFINRVVCIRDLGFNYYALKNLNRSVVFFMLIIGVVNWLGGFPLFLVCASLII